MITSSPEIDDATASLLNTWPTIHKHLSNTWAQNMLALTTLLPTAILSENLFVAPVAATLFAFHVNGRMKHLTRSFNKYNEEYTDHLLELNPTQKEFAYAKELTSEVEESLNEYKPTNPVKLGFELGGLYYIVNLIPSVPYVSDFISGEQTMVAAFTALVLNMTRSNIARTEQELYNTYQDALDDLPNVAENIVALQPRHT